MKLQTQIKAIPTNFSEKIITCKTQSFYILPAFLLITIALLIPVSINCYMIKYRTKQENWLPFYITNNEPREVSF